MSTDPHPPTDVLAPLREMIAELQQNAVTSREESGRIRRTVNVSTEAEANCLIRSEVWDKISDELSALLPALETTIVERVKAAEEAGLRRANEIINDVSTRFQPDFGTLILTAQCEIEEEYQKSGALSRLLAAEREKIIVALYEEQNINEVQVQAAIRCIRAFGEPR